MTDIGSLPEGAITIAPTSISVDQSLNFENGAWVVTTIPKTYAESRAAAYPSIGNQLDMIWHAINDGKPLDKTSAFFTAIADVKTEFPKPEANPQ